MDDIIGAEFGNLKVLQQSYKGGRKVYKCLCRCGNVVYTQKYYLTSGRQISCGCARKTNRKHMVHGGSDSRLYRCWQGIKQRCGCKSANEYERYGGRGIKVCDDWAQSFKSFEDWALANGYSDNLTIDRIDTEGDYTPDNCRWVSYKVQANNKSNNIVIHYQGQTKTLMEWCEVLNLPYSTIHKRIKESGWDYEDALSIPVRINKLEG